ncbi:MAG: response regulator [Clostridiales bacterium]|nr:response regulator [Clostridiales bacterium]
MHSKAGTAKKGIRRTNLIIPLLIILCLMTGMVIYTSGIINNISVANIQEAGEDKLSGVTAQLENYLDTTLNALWITASTVDHMTSNGATTEQIQQYIVYETEQQKQQINENFTGFYGYVRGEYLDGLNWVPPEGYDPVKRDWYIEAVKAHGDVAIVSPYIDAQTGSVVISICRQLSSPEDVVSVDFMLDRIQDAVHDLQIKEKGYGFIVGEDGMIIAHPDETRKGCYLNETEEQLRFMEKMRSTGNGNFEMEMNGKKRTVFVSRILDRWYVIIAITNDELYAEHRQQLTVNVLICLVIFALIAFFYYLGHRNEQNFSRRMEEMKAEEQKQAYETRVLKLEKEAADRANKAKSDFLADMSHEIRTPINAVLGMNEMIIRESSDALGEASPAKKEEAFGNIRDYAGNIENAGNNLLSIINDILDFSKIEAGKMELAESRYELSSLIRDVSNLISFRARDKGLEFTTDVDGNIPDELYGDKVRVRQIITNLLTNAVKYTEHGSVRLSIHADGEAFREGDAITLQIRVEDTGIGIREEDTDKLFSKFQRVDMARNSTVEGAGLGLAITHSLLSMMGGEISVESTYGKGSCFTAILPQKVMSCEPVGRIRTQDEQKRNGENAYRGSFRAPEARILIVDDTRINIAVAVGLLKKTEIQIDSAQSGQEALDLADKTKYDLILMDQRMPGMDGTETLGMLRKKKDGINAQTPVICMTADAIIGAKERYTAEGFTDYLPKPVSGETLEKKLIQYLPEEKVTAVNRKTEANETTEEENREQVSGFPEDIDQRAGLRNCQGDGELYHTLLKEYAANAEEKHESMQAYYEQKDWKQYSVFVHALKSSSRLIGAAVLSEEAAGLEKAADEGREEYISRKHDTVMQNYINTARMIQRILTEAGTTDDTDGDVLEFYPEEYGKTGEKRC